MTATHFDRDDLAQDRAMDRREERARARGQDIDTASAVAAAKGKPGPAPTVKVAPPSAVTSGVRRRSFTPVASLPPRGRIPGARQDLIDYAMKADNHGVWLRYEPTPEQEPLTIGALTTAVRKRTGGFVEGFECAVRQKCMYIRFVDPKGDGS
ncbi:hypothetical protein [Gordonia sp. NB41Y]|uniref:hypothetical protein n=1 Tax=Gordonia sp. NB41Y TaxID=875808 RepID=UPI0006B1AF60|nr:hypothetical protein [Gordonia sp. NB41Y]EMP15068.2 hypothetical protein ISGA_53 [Gordonia sp. NB41Y]WLP91344.1 hypothetical protein Q9K23_03470 [Gordonia sp. NB41Y]